MSGSVSLSERLLRVRQQLKKHQIDALIVPHDDAHLGEYTAAADERLGWISSFTGSAGVGVLMMDKAALFVDGRYTVQARQQTEGSEFACHHLIEEPYLEWLCQNLPSGSCVGIDANLHSFDWYQRAETTLTAAGMHLKILAENPIDHCWDDQPARPNSAVRLFSETLAGQSSEAKRQKIANDIRTQHVDAMILTQCESINWLLNIRGQDIPSFPVAQAFAIMYSNAAVDLFIDPTRLDNQFNQHVGLDVSVYPPTHLPEVLKRLGEDKLTIQLDPFTCNAANALALKAHGATLVLNSDPCALPKAIKNDAEIAGMVEAHRKDAVAMCQFLSWLDHAIAQGWQGSEAELAEKAESFRFKQAGYLEPSFATISALGPNAALPHYNFRNSEPRAFGQDGVYLIDSGGHYEEGTTDITRTVRVGEVRDDVRRLFTLVMKGHIALSQAKFPQGTSGIQLDVLARLPLWQAGFNFDHGTGHGVGHVLSVHEGPQRISPKGSQIALVPGMVISNEPGYYREGSFGIRCENLIRVIADPTETEITRYAFENLTLVPFDRRLLMPELLDPSEKAWLNHYHQQVFTTISPALSADELLWLEQATLTIE